MRFYPHLVGCLCAKRKRESCKLEVGKLMVDVVSVMPYGSLSMCCNLFIGNGLSRLKAMGVFYLDVVM